MIYGLIESEPTWASQMGLFLGGFTLGYTMAHYKMRCDPLNHISAIVLMILCSFFLIFFSMRFFYAPAFNILLFIDFILFISFIQVFCGKTHCLYDSFSCLAVVVNGLACKDPKLVHLKAHDFLFTGLEVAGNTSNPYGSTKAFFSFSSIIMGTRVTGIKQTSGTGKGNAWKEPNNRQ